MYELLDGVRSAEPPTRYGHVLGRDLQRPAAELAGGRGFVGRQRRELGLQLVGQQLTVGGVPLPPQLGIRLGPRRELGLPVFPGGPPPFALWRRRIVHFRRHVEVGSCGMPNVSLSVLTASCLAGRRGRGRVLFYAVTADVGAGHDEAGLVGHLPGSGYGGRDGLQVMAVIVSTDQPYALKRSATDSVKARSVEPSMVILLSS